MSKETSEESLKRLSYSEFQQSGIFDKYIGDFDDIAPVAPPRMKKIEKPDFDDLWKDLSIPVLHEKPVEQRKKETGKHLVRPTKLGEKNEKSNSKFSLMGTLKRKKKKNNNNPATPKTPSNKTSRLQRFTLRRTESVTSKTPKSPRKRRPKIKRTKTVQNDSDLSLGSTTKMGQMFSPRNKTNLRSKINRQQPTKPQEESGFFELTPFDDEIDDPFDDFDATPRGKSKGPPRLPSLNTRKGRKSKKKMPEGIEALFDNFVLTPPKKKHISAEGRTSPKNSSNSAPPGFIDPLMIQREALKMSREDDEFSHGAVRKRGKNTF